MLFYDNWCRSELFEDGLHVHAFITMDDIDRIQSTSLDLISKNATKIASKYLGNNPALCLSGGIDSQAMIGLWDKDVQYTAVIFQFENNLNEEEVEDAVNFAQSRDIPFKVIKSNVLRFLTHDLIDFGKTHNMSSPQFATYAHYICKLKDLGYTGAALGGNSFVIYNNWVLFASSKAQLTDIENFSLKSKIPCIQSFLGFYKELCIKVALSCGTIRENTSDDRYVNKIDNYIRLGLDIVPQLTKRTGFEQLKKYYNNDKYEGAFEIDFRAPLYYYNRNFQSLTFMNHTVQDFIIENSKKLNFEKYGSAQTWYNYAP